MPGEIIIYTDRTTKVVNGQSVNVPGIKVGSGNAYVQDLAFVGDIETQVIMEHINDGSIHVSSTDREKWNNKLNIDDSSEVINGALTFNRD